MDYPESIYNTFEIIEKDIYGEKHYGLVKHYNIFGIKFKRQLCVDDFYQLSKIDWEMGKKWHTKKIVMKYAIHNDNEYREYKFRKRVTK